MTGSLNINTGSYYGTGYSSTSSGSLTRTRSASSANFRTMSRNIAAGYSSDIEIIQKYMEDGKVDKALDKYEALFDDIKTTTGNYNYQLTDAEVESILKTAYQSQTGTSLVSAIEDNTSGSFWTGFKQSIPIIGFFVNGTSEAEALARLSGDELKLTDKDRVLELLGSAVGTAIWFAAGGWALKGLGALGSALKNVNCLSNLAGVLQSASGVAQAANDASNAAKGAKALINAGSIALGATSAASSVIRQGSDVIESV